MNTDNKQIRPGSRTGRVTIPASKSRAHRLLITAALSDTPTTLECRGFSNDILATVNCLNGLGCNISVENDSLIHIVPLRRDDPVFSGPAVLPCRDSGSTLRFLLPLAGVLGASGYFKMEGRLPERPLAPYDSELTGHGMSLKPEAGNRLYFEGSLKPGKYILPGDVSSQYISGLLMSLPALDGDSELKITGNIESSDYIRMTEDALRLAGIDFSYDDRTYRIPGNQHYKMPERLSVEGDWSGAAFFLCLGALSPEGILVSGVTPDSLQGDKAVTDILKQFGADIRYTQEGIFVKYAPLHGITVDASGIPDLVPVISVVAAAAKGTTHITGAGRLRLKESDRLKTTSELLASLGAVVTEGREDLVIEGCDFPANRLRGGSTDPFNDHRIAMSAAVAAAVCENPVTVSSPECVRKSFAGFWEIFDAL
ncbi:MAG: 3-phosphoshikimate 1-carboxyvinyltransferase [Lachnospiraceae bacterium]|nr:3-phosphoshikimate 1-carboxyvinyltransferase [Lachnospiraceae bacterium]